jgi:hypothetical protein
MFQIKFVEKIETHILCSVTFFFLKSCPFLDNVEKYGTAEEATADNIMWRMRFVCWIIKATNTMCSTYCIFTANMVPQTPLNITLYIRCLSC